MKEELSLKSDLCAARVFLNTFGFYLEYVDMIKSNAVIKIYNKKMNEVGCLYFEDDSIIIDANYTRDFLKASYKKLICQFLEIHQILKKQMKNGSIK